MDSSVSIACTAYYNEANVHIVQMRGNFCSFFYPKKVINYEKAHNFYKFRSGGQGMTSTDLFIETTFG